MPHEKPPPPPPPSGGGKVAENVVLDWIKEVVTGPYSDVDKENAIEKYYKDS